MRCHSVACGMVSRTQSRTPGTSCCDSRLRCGWQCDRSTQIQRRFQRTMTVLIPLIVVVASALAFVAYKHPEGYRGMCIFVLPVLVMGGLFVLAINIGHLNGRIKSAYYELQHVQKNVLSDQLAYQIRKLYEVRQSLKLF